MYEIIPGILEKDWESIERKIELVRPFARTIHIDIIDGDFAPNFTFLDPTPFKKYADDIFFELHMMVEEPIQYVKRWADYGFKRFLGHIEEMSNQQEFINMAKKYGEVGLAIDGPSSIDQVKVPFGELDTVLVMAIKAGFSGQILNPEYASKIQQIKNEILRSDQNDKTIIEVDGGINDQTIVLAKEIGANRFSATSFIFKSDNPGEQYKKLQQAIED